MSTESSVPLSYLEALGSFSILQAFMVNWLQVGLVMQVLLITVPLVSDLHRSVQYKYPVGSSKSGKEITAELFMG